MSKLTVALSLLLSMGASATQAMGCANQKLQAFAPKGGEPLLIFRGNINISSALSVCVMTEGATVILHAGVAKSSETFKVTLFSSQCAIVHTQFLWIQSTDTTALALVEFCLINETYIP